MKLGPLVPDEKYAEVLDALRGRKWCIYRPRGNAGDCMIAEGTHQLCQRHGITLCGAAECNGWIISGGGYLTGLWGEEPKVAKIISKALAQKFPVVILPHTLLHPPIILQKAKVFVREKASQDQCPGSVLGPDMSFAVAVSLKLEDPTRGEGVFLRDDQESIMPPPHNDPMGVTDWDWQEYIQLAARHQSIVTDRLHFAIASLYAGRETTLLPNSFHKNRSMWETWLKDLGCKWKETV
jgi:exopolysaccharide biosynthesis predicted pyruvyltransferase EpsI